MDEKISVEISFNGPIKRPWAEQCRLVEIEGGKSVGELLESLGYKKHELTYISINVNSEKSPLSTKLRNNDKVSIALYVGGG